ncbi:uncharacterized protein LOC109808653 isoform X2 [Cajanus cajan]|uniref:uncharacterized protein LOC109808653 isoform X2 n=1 Tax=Cajanus cajan TaxID=3821 RepID=UPI00098DAB86|nr:uncharacterized protein LOC109808653 isoform X2 [Cajanus cajan]
MTDRGRGRGTGRGISRGRGRGRGRGTTIVPPPSTSPSTSQPTHSIGEPPHCITQPTHGSTSQTPITPQSNQATPTPHVTSISQPHLVPQTNQSIPTPHVSLAQSPNMTERPQTNPSIHAAGSPIVGSSSSIDPSLEIGSFDSDGRIWIRPGPQNTFDPPIHPTREISRIIKGKFEGSWESYGEVKSTNEGVANMWFEEFQRKFKWLPDHDAQIRKAFDHKASEGLSNAMYRVRRGIDQGSWIPKQKLVELQQKWNDENWKHKSMTNANNRNSSDGSLHTGGSIPTSEHFKRLNEYGRRLSERQSQQLSGHHVASSVQSETSIFYDVVGGVNDKGRIFGLGSEAGKYKPSSSTFLEGISTPEYQQMKNLVSNLSEENKSLKEQLQSHADLIRASQEESRLVREQLKQFMEMFSQSSRPPQPPPTHDVDTVQSDDNELDDDHDIDV